MTGTVAYILAKKIALGAVSGIQNITLSPTGQLIFQFKDGSSATWQIPLPKDGVSIVKVEIDKNKHLICTMSDNSTIDAGEIPGGTGGGLVQAANKSALPTVGADDTLYITKNDDTLYYWDGKYKPISSSGADTADIKTSSDITFDGVETTFNLPIDDKEVMVYLNGMYLTENEDYTIDRTVTPNTITFIEVWEEEDICTIAWIKGIKGGGGSTDVTNASFAKKEDIDKLFTNLPDIEPDNQDIYAKKEDIDKLFSGSFDPIPDKTSLATKQDIDKLFI